MKYIYLFPLDSMTNEDKQYMKKYNLEILGKNFFNSERNLVVRGELSNLKRYCKEWLAYEMHPDYLYKENEFAGDIKDSVKDYKPELLAELKKIAIEGEKNKDLINKALKAYYEVGNNYSWDKLKKENPKKAEMLIKGRELAEKRAGELAKKWDRIIEEMNRGKKGHHANFEKLSNEIGMSLLPTLKQYEEIEQGIKNLEASRGKSPYAYDSLNSYMFTSKDSNRRYLIKAKNTQDAITKFYNTVKVKDEKFYVYLHSPAGSERIGEANSLEEAKKIKEKKDKEWKPGYYWHTEITTKKLQEKNYWDSKTKDSDRLEELLRTLEDRADDLTASITNDEEKFIYSGLYKLVQDIISQTEKEIDSAKGENKNPAKESLANKILNTSKILENYSRKAKNKSAEAKLLALSKELYRCYDRNRKYK